jgi:hypothetical protein
VTTAQSPDEGDSHTDRSVGHLFDRQLDVCPACGSDRLDPVVENESQNVHFFCGACGRCWHVELGYVHRVIPPTCPGCPERERCEAVYATDQFRDGRDGNASS